MTHFSPLAVRVPWPTTCSRFGRASSFCWPACSAHRLSDRPPGVDRRVDRRRPLHQRCGRLRACRHCDREPAGRGGAVSLRPRLATLAPVLGRARQVDLVDGRNASTGASHRCALGLPDPRRRRLPRPGKRPAVADLGTAGPLRAKARPALRPTAGGALSVGVMDVSRGCDISQGRSRACVTSWPSRVVAWPRSSPKAAREPFVSQVLRTVTQVVPSCCERRGEPQPPPPRSHHRDRVGTSTQCPAIRAPMSTATVLRVGRGAARCPQPGGLEP